MNENKKTTPRPVWASPLAGEGGGDVFQDRLFSEWQRMRGYEISEEEAREFEERYGPGDK